MIIINTHLIITYHIFSCIISLAVFLPLLVRSYPLSLYNIVIIIIFIWISLQLSSWLPYHQYHLCHYQNPFHQHHFHLRHYHHHKIIAVLIILIINITIPLPPQLSFSFSLALSLTSLFSSLWFHFRFVIRYIFLFGLTYLFTSWKKYIKKYIVRCIAS